jgi:hypothetical protein
MHYDGAMLTRRTFLLGSSAVALTASLGPVAADVLMAMPDRVAAARAKLIADLKAAGIYDMIAAMHVPGPNGRSVRVI